MKACESNVTRRKFMRTGAIGAGAAAGALAAPAIVTAQSPIVLKMQSSWPSSDIFQDMAKQYVDRVEAMSGGRLRIDLLPASAVVVVPSRSRTPATTALSTPSTPFRSTGTASTKPRRCSAQARSGAATRRTCFSTERPSLPEHHPGLLSGHACVSSTASACARWRP
jgi:hypothetical protein